ncbi:hypothetical protein SAMN05428948_0635 [Massilia sp. CF038]|nr:hypothetical protein SAMN05428948_0635 [Massilia sp. CF038]
MKHYLNTLCAAALVLPAIAHSAEVGPILPPGRTGAAPPPAP